MKKYILFLTFVFLCVFILTACASVNSQGIDYFIGRSESDLINHFGYNGIDVGSSNSEYDKVLFFSNKNLIYQMSKTEYVRYKVTRQSEILNIMFNQFSDGCLTFYNSAYYGNHYGIEGIGPNARTIHRNDNSSIRPVINNFNNIINRSDAFPNSQRDAVFDRSRIGDTYYLFNNTSRLYYSSGVSYIGADEIIEFSPSEAYTKCNYIVWRIDVIAEDRPETESWIVAIYDERFDYWLSGNGNNIITQERANAIINEYISNGFTRRVVTEGHSLRAYIKNGKIVNVE